MIPYFAKSVSRSRVSIAYESGALSERRSYESTVISEAAMSSSDSHSASFFFVLARVYGPPCLSPWLRPSMEVLDRSFM